MANSEQYPPLAGDDIDLDRVVIDPRYRRRIIERLRAEAVLRPLQQGSVPSATRSD